MEHLVRFYIKNNSQKKFQLFYFQSLTIHVKAFARHMPESKSQKKELPTFESLVLHKYIEPYNDSTVVV